MKIIQTILILFTLLSCAFITNAQRIKGSDTVLPLSQKWAESYMNSTSTKKVTVTGGGSGVGISALHSGSTDIAQASRSIKFVEKQKLSKEGIAVKELVVAYDALAIVIHPSNKVNKLTREQLEGIFTGKIKNWKEVGGADMKIVPYSRETSSGTYEFFRINVLKHKNYMSGIMSMPATGAIVQSISQTKGAIGYIGFAYLNQKVKAVHVSYDSGKSYVAPSMKNAENKTYPIVRPLLYYYETKSEAKLEAFIKYIFSPAGQKVVSEVGFIAVGPK